MPSQKLPPRASNLLHPRQPPRHSTCHRLKSCLRGRLAQLVRALRSHRRGRVFESRVAHCSLSLENKWFSNLATFASEAFSKTANGYIPACESMETFAMPKLSQQFPNYRKHRASGQVIVELSGKRHYRGPHGAKASPALGRLGWSKSRRWSPNRRGGSWCDSLPVGLIWTTTSR